MNYKDKSKDIPEQKKTDEALHDAIWKLECIISGTNIGIWEWNIQTGKILINKELAKSSGLMKSHFSGQLPYFDYEYRLKHKSGHWVWVHVRGLVSSHTADGKPLMMFGTCTDSSERKQAEAEIKSQTEQLQNLIAEKDKYFSIIAHDLQNPFNGFLGLTQMMAEELQ